MIDATIPRPRRIARPDATLHGEETGTGPTLLLLHAGGERRHVWRPVNKVLKDAGFRCVTYDQRGHGDSSGSAGTLAACAADVAAMLSAEPPECVVVGASLGGLAAVAALADPAIQSKTSGLVLVDVVPCLDQARVRRFLTAGGLHNAYAQLVDDILAHVPQLEQITQALNLPLLLIHSNTASNTGSSLTDEDITRLLRLAPATTIRTVHDAGHLIARDQPATLARTLIEATSTWR